MFQAYIKLVGNNDLSEKKRVSFVLDLFGFCNYVTKMLHFSKHPSNCSFFRIIKTLFMTLIYKTCLKRYKSRQFVQMSAFVDDYSPQHYDLSTTHRHSRSSYTGKSEKERSRRIIRTSQSFENRIPGRIRGDSVCDLRYPSRLSWLKISPSRKNSQVRSVY